MCCRYVELPLARPLTRDEANWVELHPGIAMKDARTVRIETNCSALQPDGLCGLYGTPLRPEMCGRWPDGPNQAPEGCVYQEV